MAQDLLDEDLFGPVYNAPGGAQPAGQDPQASGLLDEDLFPAYQPGPRASYTPPLTKNLMEMSEGLRTSPSTPGFVKEGLNIGLAAGGALEEGVQAVAGVAIDAAANVESLAKQAVRAKNKVIGILTGDDEVAKRDLIDPALEHNRPSLIQELKFAKDYAKKNILEPEQAERISKAEKVLKHGIPALATAGMASAAGKAVSNLGMLGEATAVSAIGGSEYAIVSALVDDDGNLTFGELAQKAAIGGVVGGTVGLVGGLVLKSSITGIESVKQGIRQVQDKLPGADKNILKREAVALGDLFKNNPESKEIYNGLKEANVRPFYQDVAGGNKVVAAKVQQARPMTAVEEEAIRQIDEANQQALAKLFGSKVEKSLDYVFRGKPNLVAESAMIDDMTSTVRSVRQAANAHPSVANVYRKIDQALPLDDKTINLLNQTKSTNPIINKVARTFQTVKEGTAKAAMLKARSGDELTAYLENSVAAYSRTGSHNTTVALDMTRKQLAREALAETDPFLIKQTRAAMNIIDKQLERYAPGYMQATKDLADLKMFPNINKNPILRSYLAESGSKGAKDILKAVFNPSTQPLERQEILKFFADGVRNEAGNLVIPGNKVLLAAATKANLTTQFGKLSDLNKNFTQAFVNAFQKSPAQRAMYNDIFKTITGKDINVWTKTTKLLDASFAKYGNSFVNGTGVGSLVDAIAKNTPGGAGQALVSTLTYAKRKALFNFMYKADWQQLLDQVGKQKSFSAQVNALGAAFLGGMGAKLFDFSDDPQMNEYLKAIDEGRTPLDRDKQITRNRGF